PDRVPPDRARRDRDGGIRPALSAVLLRRQHLLVQPPARGALGSSRAFPRAGRSRAVPAAHVRLLELGRLARRRARPVPEPLPPFPVPCPEPRARVRAITPRPGERGKSAGRGGALRTEPRRGIRDVRQHVHPRLSLLLLLPRRDPRSVRRIPDAVPGPVRG